MMKVQDVPLRRNYVLNRQIAHVTGMERLVFQDNLIKTISPESRGCILFR